MRLLRSVPTRGASDLPVSPDLHKKLWRGRATVNTRSDYESAAANTPHHAGPTAPGGFSIRFVHTQYQNLGIL